MNCLRGKQTEKMCSDDRQHVIDDEYIRAVMGGGNGSKIISSIEFFCSLISPITMRD